VRGRREALDDLICLGGLGRDRPEGPRQDGPRQNGPLAVGARALGEDRERDLFKYEIVDR
jgi:hypothetical protein